jgi:cysteine-rich repeat protein
MIGRKGFFGLLMFIFLIGVVSSAQCYDLTPLTPCVGAGSPGMYDNNVHTEGWNCEGGSPLQDSVTVTGGSCDTSFAGRAYTLDGTYEFDEGNSGCLENGPQCNWRYTKDSGSKVLSISYTPDKEFEVTLGYYQDSVGYTGSFSEGIIRENFGRLRGEFTLNTDDGECTGTAVVNLGTITGESYCRGGEVIVSDNALFSNFIFPNVIPRDNKGVVVLDNGEYQCYKVTESASCDGAVSLSEKPILKKSSDTISCCLGGSWSVCGDSTIDAWNGEICDDGNTVSGDGCDENCLEEDPEDYACGNGKLETANGETCDDGNTVSGDGCSSTCSGECSCPSVDTVSCAGTLPDKYILEFSGVTLNDGSPGDISVEVPWSKGSHQITNEQGNFYIGVSGSLLDVYWGQGDDFDFAFMGSFNHGGDCCSISSGGTSNEITPANCGAYYCSGSGGTVSVSSCSAPVVGVCTDEDEDGVCLEDGDCNDEDATVKPGIPENCDNLNVDDNCDGAADCLDIDECADALNCGLECDEDKDGDGWGVGGEEDCDCNDNPDDVAAAPDAGVGLGNSIFDGFGSITGAWGIFAGEVAWDGRGTALWAKRNRKDKGNLAAKGNAGPGREINPGAPEICDNGIDDDCDRKIDCADHEDCALAPNCDIFNNLACVDNDGDLYPEDSKCRTNIMGCGPNKDEECIRDKGSDCHDDSVNANPGFANENGEGFCGDLLDNDCDANDNIGGGFDCADEDCKLDIDCRDCESWCSPDLPDVNLCDSEDEIIMKLDFPEEGIAVPWDFESEYEFCLRGREGNWKFDEGAGDTAFDSSGNGFDGVLEGSENTASSGPEPYNIVFVKWDDTFPGADSCQYVVPDWDANKNRYEVKACSNDDFCCYCTSGYNSTGRNGGGITNNYCYPAGSVPDESGEGPSWVDGKVGEEGKKQSALEFSGSTRVDVSNPAELNPTSELSIEFLIKTGDSNADIGALFSRHWDLVIAPNWAQRLMISSGKFQFGYVGDVQLEGSANIANNAWHHVVVTHDGEDLRLYIDGNEDSSVSADETFLRSNSNTYIGNSNYAGFFGIDSFEGTLDEVSFYKRALTEEEIEGRSELFLVDNGLCADREMSYYRYEVCSPNGEIVDHDEDPLICIDGEDGTVYVTPASGNCDLGDDDVPINFGGELSCSIVEGEDVCQGDVIASLTDDSGAFVYAGDAGEIAPFKVCCGGIYWANTNGKRIDETDVGDSIKMVYKGAGTPGDEITFEIFDFDHGVLDFDEDIRTIDNGEEIKATIDDDGSAIVELELTEADYNLGHLESGEMEFYFKANGVESNHLNLMFGGGVTNNYPFDLAILSPKCGDYFYNGDTVDIKINATDYDDIVSGSITVNGVRERTITNGLTVIEDYPLSGGNVKIVVEGSVLRGDSYELTSNIMVIDRRVVEIYSASCIDEPTNFQDAEALTVWFNATSSRAIKYDGSNVIDLGKDDLYFDWIFSDGRTHNGTGDVPNEESYAFFKTFKAVGQGQGANLSVTYVG